MRGLCPSRGPPLPAQEARTLPLPVQEWAPDTWTPVQPGRLLVDRQGPKSPLSRA